MAKDFDHFSIGIDVTAYFEKIENFVNQGIEEHLKFIFKLFDVFNEDKITEAGLFKFMEDASLKRADLTLVPTEMLSLDEQENDIFIDYFTNTFTKIVEALSKKLKKLNMKVQAEAMLSQALSVYQKLQGSTNTPAAKSADKNSG